MKVQSMPSTPPQGRVEMTMPESRWRRTAFEGLNADVDIAPDDWCLQNASGQSLARIYKVADGPQDGRWFWAVQVGREGKPFNGGTSYADKGREAKEGCEARVLVKPPSL